MTVHRTTFRTLAPAAALLLALAGSASAQQRIDQRRPASADGTVEISNMAGSVTVVGWNRNEVQVTGTLGRGAERLHFATEGGHTVVRVINPRNARGVQGSTIEVRVPARAGVEVHGTSASVQVSGVSGAVEVGSVSGSVGVTGTPRRVEAASVSGDVTVSAAGDVEVSAVSGNVNVTGASGRAEVSTVSGNVRLTGRNLSGEFNTVTGTLILRGGLAPNGALEINAHSGDVEMHLPRGTGATVEFTTFSGDLDVDAAGARTTRQGRRESTVTLGRGGARVSVNSFSGNLRIADQ